MSCCEAGIAQGRADALTCKGELNPVSELREGFLLFPGAPLIH